MSTHAIKPTEGKKKVRRRCDQVVLRHSTRVITSALTNKTAADSRFSGSEPGFGLPGEMRTAVTADVIALPVKPHTRVCEEVINRRGRSHVYVSSSRAVDVSLGTKRSGFRAHTSKRKRDRKSYYSILARTDGEAATSSPIPEQANLLAVATAELRKVHNGGRGQEASKHGHHKRTCRERLKPFNSNHWEVKRQMNTSHENHFSKGVHRPYAICVGNRQESD
ncbi:uncharacterized [Tachysurus ichikawai]